MKKVLILFIVPFISFSQLFTIETDYMEIYNLSSVNNFSENTYVNTLENINMSYQIIVDSMPPSWDFQHCFPECHPINTYEIDPISFPSDSSVFLKGHFYPNNVSGEGLLIMEIEANHGLYVDTVIWRGTAMEETSLTEYLNASSEIKYITNLMGQQIVNLNSEDIIIVTYKSNKSKTYYILK
jgi:hypothetical protein